MRYAEVLLLAAEASLQSGNASKAAGYVNKVRDRAQLPALGNVSMDDIKKEKRLELWMEGCRYQDLIRWIRLHLIRFITYNRRIFIA